MRGDDFVNAIAVTVVLFLMVYGDPPLQHTTAPDTHPEFQCHKGCTHEAGDWPSTYWCTEFEE